MTVQEAINHYEYGITHDIFSEPVTTYAKMAVEALEKQIPKKPKFKTTCANCGTHNSVWGRLANPKGHPIVYCWNCGQANELDWEEGGTSD